MRIGRLALFTAAFIGATQSLSAQSMFVRAPSQNSGYGYGNTNWTYFTGLFDAKFGAANITKGNSVGSLAGYSALLLDANQPFTSAYNLTPGEISTIQTFLAGGGRLYAFGENAAWASWNANLLSLFGATGGGAASDVGTPLVANSLTAGVGSIDTPAPGAIDNFNGGVDLFSNHIAGLFNSNSVVVLDINICDDGFSARADNKRFCQNIVDFTAGAPVEVGPVTAPEPASLAMVGFGLAVAGVVARRRKARQ
ncbi:MAG: PEP-CTERM sorting domain-containing protein [Gemmatimonas sp.]